MMRMKESIEILHFTDPLCFWCYAMEPEIRKMRVLLDDLLDYRIVMGVLSSDVSEIIGSDPESELRYEFFRMSMADHLTQAAQAVGMPFCTERLFSQSPEDMVSLPLGLAYSAMVLTNACYAEAYLRRMRECVFAEGRTLAKTDDQIQLASEFPIDIEQFRNNLVCDDAMRILQEGVDECQLYGVSMFPTLLMSYGESRIMVNGYLGFDGLRQAVAQLTDGNITLSETEYSLKALETFVQRFGKVAAREVQVAFSLSNDQLANAMMDLVSTGRYKTQDCGNSYFVVPTASTQLQNHG